MERPNRTIGIFLLLAFLFFGIAIGAQLSYGEGDFDPDTIYQYSTIGALLNGIFDGDLSMEGLLSYGDFGLGTLNALDGELIILDGNAYQVRHDGSVVLVDGDELTPFACITKFDIDDALEVAEESSMEDIGAIIVDRMPSQNFAYAIRIEGLFSYMKTRSPRSQTLPYPGLVEALADQSVFNLEYVEGTIVGFWSPSYVDGINVSGFHLHFISDGKDAGGHVLDFDIVSGNIQIDVSYGIWLDLPKDGAFMELNAQSDPNSIEKAEK